MNPNDRFTISNNSQPFLAKLKSKGYESLSREALGAVLEAISFEHANLGVGGEMPSIMALVRKRQIIPEPGCPEAKDVPQTPSQVVQRIVAATAKATSHERVVALLRLVSSRTRIEDHPGLLYAPEGAHDYVKAFRPFLPDPAEYLDHVLAALEAGNDSVELGIYWELLNGVPAMPSDDCVDAVKRLMDKAKETEDTKRYATCLRLLVSAPATPKVIELWLHMQDSSDPEVKRQTRTAIAQALGRQSH